VILHCWKGDQKAIPQGSSLGDIWIICHNLEWSQEK